MNGVGDAKAPSVSSHERLLSLDAFRGLVIVLMFLVNVAGTDPAFPSWFPHRGWNGGQMGNGLADYVFPWFLFVVGVAIPFSLNSGRGARLTRGAKLAAAARRGLIIYLLGTLLWCATIGYRPADPLATWHGPITWRVILHWDILPLIGWAYFLGVCVYLMPASRAARIGFIIVVLAAKYLILRVLPYPGEATVVWEQSRSMQSWINGRIGWAGVAMTQGLPAAACVMLGSLAGDWLRRTDLPIARRAGRLLAFGIAGYAVGLASHLTGVLPQSKDFFTSSYVLGTAGAAAATLGLLTWLVDGVRWTRLTFLRVFGMNALVAYIGAELIWKMVLTRWDLANPSAIGGSSVAIVSLKAHLHALIGADAGSWALVLGYTLAYWLVCWTLYRRGVFLRV